MKEGLPFALGTSIRNPFSRELLRRCVLAQRPVSLDELAESMDGLRSTIRDHAEELEMLGALKVSEELWPWRPAGHRYEATDRLMESTWALTGLGLMPGDRWGLPDEQAEKINEQAEKINEHIAERRKDKEFTERLRRRMEEDRDVLEALAGPDRPVRLWRRARAWLRSAPTRRLKTRRTL
jgi:predicted ArsR family transcriptional regulator